MTEKPAKTADTLEAYRRLAGGGDDPQLDDWYEKNLTSDSIYYR